MPFDDLGEQAPRGFVEAFIAPDWQQFVPDVNHVSETIMITTDSSLLSVIELPGHPFQLEEIEVRNTRRQQYAELWQGIADNNVTLATHLVHYRCHPAADPPRMLSGFGTGVMSTYRRNCLTGHLYANRWFLTVMVAPRFTPGRALRRFLTTKASAPSAAAGRVRQLQAITQRIMSYVGPHGGRLLGYRDEDGQRYSRIAEARRLCLYGRYRPVPLLEAPIGAMIYNERVVCGSRAIRICGFDGPRYAKTLAFNRYPGITRTGQLAHILDLKCDFVLAQTMRFASRSSSETSIYFRQTHLINAGVQERAAAALGDAAEDVQSGQSVRGDHNFALIVHAPDLESLDVAAGAAATAIDKAGASPIIDDNNAFAGFWTTVPGNPEWLAARKGDIRSDNFAALTEFNSYPTGQTTGEWGSGLVEFRTAADTVFAWSPMVGKVGHTLFLGLTRSGKTLLMNFLLTTLEQVPARVFYFDYDHCAEPMIRAADGIYLALRKAAQSGLAPLRGLTNTPENCVFLTDWLAGLMRLDGRGELQNDTRRRLWRGVSRVMKLPVAMRRIGGVRSFLGFEAGGDGERLDVWCHDGPDGWLFDGDQDQIETGARMVGWDMTDILKHAAVPAAAAYLLHRIRPEIDGRPVVIACPEARYYLTSPLFAGIIEDFALGLAKKNGALWLDTQEPQHLLDSSVGASLVSQCASIWQFPTTTASRPVYLEKLGFSPAMFRAITEQMATLGFRSALLRRQGESVILNVELTDMSEDIDVLSGTEETVRLIPAIVAKVGNGPAFHREFVRQVAARRKGP